MSFEQLILDFDGNTFDKNKDGRRLANQLRAVYDIMSDGQWHTLDQIERITGYEKQSISARLRDLRKTRFGSHTIERRRFTAGVYEYRLIKNPLSYRNQDDSKCLPS